MYACVRRTYNREENISTGTMIRDFWVNEGNFVFSLRLC